MKQRGPLTYDVQIGQHQVKVHVDHHRASKASTPPSRADDSDFLDYSARNRQKSQSKKMQLLIHLRKFNLSGVILSGVILKGSDLHQKD